MQHLCTFTVFDSSSEASLDVSGDSFLLKIFNTVLVLLAQNHRPVIICRPLAVWSQLQQLT